MPHLNEKGLEQTAGAMLNSRAIGIYLHEYNPLVLMFLAPLKYPMIFARRMLVKFTLKSK